MYALSDNLRVWGHIATAHYTHGPRSAATLIHLSSRADFTGTPGLTLYRAAAFFSGYVAQGTSVDLMAAPVFGPPQFVAEGLTEFICRLLVDNCGASAVISQFHRVPAAAVAADVIAETRIVAFHRPSNDTVAFKHVVKTFPGGRSVSAQEAIDTARANARAFSLDLSTLEMRVTTEPAAIAAVDYAAGRAELEMFPNQPARR
jgi:hypothetical protein